MNGQDGFRAKGDAAGGVGDVDVEGIGVAIDEYGGCADPRDAPGGSEKGERGAENFIAGTDAKSHEPEKDGVGARRNTDGVFRSRKLGNRLFKYRHFAAQNELAGSENAFERGTEFRRKCGVLFFEIEDGNQRSFSHVNRNKGL